MNLPFLVPLREILRTYLIVYLFVDLFGTYSFYSVVCTQDIQWWKVYLLFNISSKDRKKMTPKPFCLVILKLDVENYTLIFKTKILIFDYDYDHRLVRHVQMHFIAI